MRIFAFLFVGLLTASVLTTGCTKSNPTTIVDTVHVKDTIDHHDTVTTGPAFVRFIAFLNNSQTVVLKREVGSLFIPFTSVASQSSRQYLPIRGDTVLNLQGSFFDSTKLIDGQNFLIPQIGAGTLVTVALFQVPGPSLVEVFKSDPIPPPPSGFGYLRVINACADFPTPHPTVEAYLDDLSNPALFNEPSSTTPKFISYQDMSDYVLVPVGSHSLLLKGQLGTVPDYTAPLNVTDGGYYTARLIGTRTAGNDRLIIDTE